VKSLFDQLLFQPLLDDAIVLAAFTGSYPGPLFVDGTFVPLSI
jgi:hypothetical protein